jgi:hypothetical protein
MHNGGNSVGVAVTICEECSFLACGFASIKFIHYPRESNIVAYNLGFNAC